MFERLTQAGRRVVVLAQDEARSFDHNFIGTWHILLGLIREGDGVAAKSLQSLGVSLEVARSQVEEMIGRGQQPLVGHIPFTTRGKKVLDQSLRVALRFSHNYVGTEHILLALMSVCEAGDDLRVQFGIDARKLEQKVLRAMGVTTPEAEHRSPQTPASLSLRGSRRGYFGVAVWHPKHEVNIGTLWRSAHLYGAAFIATVGRRYEPQASDTSGTANHVPLFAYDTIDDLVEHLPHSCPLIGVELTPEAVLLPQFHHPIRGVYLLGAEDHGLPLKVLKRCHQVVQIPTDKPWSMNVSTAGTVVMYDRWTRVPA